ncbi:hypothetical protein OM416_10535 [Paenibacillus sp. LS1]|uniref:GNAT family N-acetyltransferase n=1 Tax=Paenibacillus sp. LS1 TaxID=2992120 RepID=UPI00222F29DF|nr:GNAT family N-acetyltransferase [Paenibacillus sp. LS1]MCW3792021.1 hypothetical protein [Paenibacillus sp. LS1]
MGNIKIQPVTRENWEEAQIVPLLTYWKGYGKSLIMQAESMASQLGCKLSHTSTFSYQSPEFYQNMGYNVFGVIDEYPDGIIQYFLKKRL